MLIQIIDNLRYPNLHVLWLKVEWIDLTFMPCEHFETSLKTSIWSIFDDIVVCPLSHQTGLHSMDHDDVLHVRVFFLTM
jgi:hypothetical protein